MPTRQVFHQRLLYLSEQVQKLERLGYFDKTLHESVEEEYKDDTKKIRVLVVIGSILLGIVLTALPSLLVGLGLSTIPRAIMDNIFLKNLYASNQAIGSIFYGVNDIICILLAWIILTIPFVIIGIVIGYCIKKSARQKKIDDFSKNSAKMEQNLKEAQRIYEEIREDLVNWVPVEHRNAKDLRKLSECFALYNISSIPEAIEMIKAGKV